MDTDDPSNFEGRFEAELRRLQKADDIAEADQKAIKRFIRAKDGALAVSSLTQYSVQLRATAGRAEKPLVEMDEDDAIDLFFSLRHDFDLSEAAVANGQKVARLFWIHQGHDWAETLEVLTPERKPVDRNDMLDAEDINALRKAASNLRDVALVEFLADTGARRTLTAGLRVRDVDLEGERATYTPNPNTAGLKGASVKPYPLIDSKGIIRTFLRTSHPRADEPEAALFHKLKDYGDSIEEDKGAISPDHMEGHLKTIGRRAGIEKPLNPHNFRHSAVSRMVREGYTRSQIEHRVHWTLDSNMWKTYEHVTGREHNNDIFSHAGVGDSEDETRPERHPCGNCGETLAPHHEVCPRCFTAATREMRELFNSALASLGDGQAEVEDLKRRKVRALVQRGLLEDATVLGDHEAPPSSSESSH